MQRSQTFTNTKATLYVIATPIGNLQEISPRIIDAINDSEVIFCEDTRVSLKILQHLNIQKTLISAYENIEKSASIRVLSYLHNNQNVAIVSDAGYPGISDPGQLIIQEAINNNFNIAVINGPSALIHSMVASGFSTDHFYFYGFLPPKSSKRKATLEDLKTFKDPIIFYQSPHKIKECLKDILEVLGDRKICLCRELTKKFEEFIRGNISEIIPICEQLKGEMVVVLQGNQQETKQELNNDLKNIILKEIDAGLSTKEAIKKVSTLHKLKKSDVYNFFHQGDEEYEK